MAAVVSEVVVIAIADFAFVSSYSTLAIQKQNYLNCFEIYYHAF